MPWNATLVDGPHEGRTVAVEDEDISDPPVVIDVDGESYVYAGFANNVPRYRHDTKR